MDEDFLGKIAGADRCYRIESTVSIAAPIEAVWETATDSEKVGRWFSPGTIEGERGRIQLNFANGEFGMAGEVKILFRPHVFEFTWEANEHSDRTTIVRFDFIQTEQGTTLATVTSLVFDQLETVYLVLATWRFMLERMQQAAVTKATIPDDEARVATLVQAFKRLHEQQMARE